MTLHTLAAGSADEQTVVEEVVVLVNTVYAVAEEGLWAAGALRTSAEEIADYIRSGQITVSILGDRIVGCIRTQQLDGYTGEFGMLAVAEGHRGTGLGCELVAFAERQSLEQGRATMQLELLVPRTWSHTSKEFLAGWYRRIGYRIIRRGTIDEYYPHLAPLLATPCDFVIYSKDLTSQSAD
ncbi:GNAT family N-acetyltransferase [Mycobacterium sp. 21AC1]|uniref:GNAT family N-acetyltransferase n=1 Tax=[Mycobacterium] appelbergii TaxID=2939269 RepID=UPI002939463E|nr:GNAT family N-acetyltransferase [Mycobacterium sp. 21AC1]MDV3128375.1 GNAT family N-acetyltransferase [Mycobacterium sp. 21AC1]